LNFIIFFMVLYNVCIGQNVGIGTTTPAAKLQIIDSAKTRTTLMVASKSITDSSQIIFTNADSIDQI
jgi:hypothetical protein